MSTGTVISNNGNYLHIDNNTEKIFLFDNEYSSGALPNATGADKTYNAGTILGRISATNKLIPLESDAQDGSAKPVGILAQTITIANGAEKSVHYCIAGSVSENKLIFENGTDTLSTVTDTYIDGTAVGRGRTIKDALEGDTKGIKIVATEDLTGFDNQ